MDFVHDQFATGPKLRVLTVVDTVTRFSPAVVPQFSFRAPDVVEVLEQVCGEMDYPAQSALTKAASSSRATWTCGHIPEVSRSISADRANRQTTCS